MPTSSTRAPSPPSARRFAALGRADTPAGLLDLLALLGPLAIYPVLGGLSKARTGAGQADLAGVVERLAPELPPGELMRVWGMVQLVSEGAARPGALPALKRAAEAVSARARYLSESTRAGGNARRN